MKWTTTSAISDNGAYFSKANKGDVSVGYKCYLEKDFAQRQFNIVYDRTRLGYPNNLHLGRYLTHSAQMCVSLISKCASQGVFFFVLATANPQSAEYQLL